MSKNHQHKRADQKIEAPDSAEILVADPEMTHESMSKPEEKAIQTNTNSLTKKTAMKTFYFNIQAKGGTGKSFLTVLQAYKEEENNDSLFVCLDTSTRSTMKNLRFMEGKNPKRIAEASLLDERMKIVRDKLLSTIEALNQIENGYDRFYLDFGAPESQQFPELISQDLTPKDLKAFEEHLKVKFVFNIVVAGGTAYTSCTEYLDKLVQLLGDMFEVNILANKATFYNFNHLLDELGKYTKEMGSKVASLKVFGDFDTANDTGKVILANIEQGNSVKELSFTANLKMQNELQKI